MINYDKAYPNLVGLQSKQHRAICYLFELGADLLLDRSINVSTSPGFEGLLAICPTWPQDSVRTLGECLLLSSIMPRGETFCMQDCRFASSTKHRTRASKNTFCQKWTFWTSGPEKRPLPP